MKRVGMSPEELAQLLGVNVMTVYRQIKAGKLKATKFGGKFVIMEPDLAERFGEEKARVLSQAISDEVSE